MTGIPEGFVDHVAFKPVVLMQMHHEIHEGDAFYDYGQVTLASAATHNVLFITPDTAKWAHIVPHVRATGEAHYQIFEGAEVSANGTVCDIFNRNRNSTDVSTCACYKNPTVTADGVEILTEHFGSGKTIGGSSRDENERILKQNTIYLLRLTSEAAANDISWIFDWYEHTNADV